MEEISVSNRTDKKEKEHRERKISLDVKFIVFNPDTTEKLESRDVKLLLNFTWMSDAFMEGLVQKENYSGLKMSGNEVCLQSLKERQVGREGP